MITADNRKNAEKTAQNRAQNKGLWSRQKSANFLDISVSGLDRLIKKKALRAYKINNRVKLKESDIQRFLRANATTTK